MRKICPFIEPWPFVMIALNRLRNSFTMTPESIPAGGRTAVTAEPGELEKTSRPSSVTAALVARASSCALATTLSMPSALMYFSDSANASSSEVFGVQADSPLAAFFFSFFRSK